ncbi:hypothetical protein D9Q98_006624 [Chlorella vulgaris]|uniref:Uncharacterized protein n=1 Tax=Chlorella vulgaris TaxID=3077 RepID=A0A9D4TKI2_CHLVU|nr:hypothetical protein D9Q98_006624 [Chlorella vulgaris]
MSRCPAHEFTGTVAAVKRQHDPEQHCVTTLHTARRRRRRPNWAAAASPAAAPPVEPPEFGLALEPVLETPLVDASLAANDADFIGFIRRQYKLGDVRVARGKALRVLTALQMEDSGVQALSLQRDVLPKLELLEALSPGLGWKVLKACPEEFASPEALERWRLAAAYLHTIGIPPRQISALFARHRCLFKQAVAAPDNLRRLFQWLQRDLGLEAEEILKIVNRVPAVLHADVEGVLKPRMRFLLNLGLSQERVVTALQRMPELLGVDSRLLASKAAYLEQAAGMSRAEVAVQLVGDPAALLCSLAHLEEVVAWLSNEMGLQAGLLRKVVARGGVAKYPVATLRERVAFWRGLGFSQAELTLMLDRMPRLLLYPMHAPKYQLKLAFMTEELRLPLSALVSFPAYVSYSLPRRIAPRAAAARELGRDFAIQLLSRTDEAFAAWLGWEPEEWQVFAAAWQCKEDAARWADPQPPQPAALDCRDV